MKGRNLEINLLRVLGLLLMVLLLLVLVVRSLNYVSWDDCMFGVETQPNRGYWSSLFSYVHFMIKESLMLILNIKRGCVTS